MTTPLIVLAGPDGAGKSTLVDMTTNWLKSQGLRAASFAIFDALAGLTISADDLRPYLAKLVPESRLLFFAHALLQAHSRKVSAADVLICDGYWYKYAANELALGVQENIVQTVAQILPAADLCIYLPVAPEVAADRKPKMSAYECGFRDVSRANFIAFQQQTAGYWQGWAQEWPAASEQDLTANFSVIQAVIRDQEWMPW